MSGLELSSPSRVFEGIVHNKARGGAKHPRHLEFQAAIAMLISHGDLEHADHLLRDLLKVNSFDPHALVYLAKSARARKNLELAEVTLRQLAKRHPVAIHFFELANCYYDLGRDHDSLQNYFLALRQMPDDTHLLFETYKNIGNIFVRSRDFDSAEDNYNKAYTLRPDSAVLMINFGTLEIQRENWHEAGERFRQAIALDENEDRAWVGLSLVHRHHSDRELSWASLDKALDLNPTNETALQLGLSWLTTDQQWQRMIPRLEAYLAVQGESVELSFALAQLYYISGRLEWCLIEVERTLLLDPAFKQAHDLQSLAQQEVASRQERWG